MMSESDFVERALRSAVQSKLACTASFTVASFRACKSLSLCSHVDMWDLHRQCVVLDGVQGDSHACMGIDIILSA